MSRPENFTNGFVLEELTIECEDGDEYHHAEVRLDLLGGRAFRIYKDASELRKVANAMERAAKWLEEEQ
jgi:hypothetical protein